MGMLAVVELQHTGTRGACPYLAVLPLNETGDVAAAVVGVEGLHLHILERLPVVYLQGTPHAQVEQTVAVLKDAVHIVAGHLVVLLLFLFQDDELVTVVSVEAITGSCPDKTVIVEINLVGETARQLLIGVEQAPHLCPGM